MSKEKFVNGFMQFSRQSYYEVMKDDTNRIEEFNIGSYGYENGKTVGGTKGEFSIRWKTLGVKGEIAGSIRIFTDAWHLMGQPIYQDLFKRLSTLNSDSKGNFTPQQVLEQLKACGFTDLSDNEEESSSDIRQLVETGFLDLRATSQKNDIDELLENGFIDLSKK